MSRTAQDHPLSTDARPERRADVAAASVAGYQQQLDRSRPPRNLREPESRPVVSDGGAAADVAHRLQQARLMEGFRTQIDASRHLGIKNSTYAAHENGSRHLRRDMADFYAKEFNVSTEWLYFGRGTMRPSPPPGSAAQPAGARLVGSGSPASHDDGGMIRAPQRARREAEDGAVEGEANAAPATERPGRRPGLFQSAAGDPMMPPVPQTVEKEWMRISVGRDLDVRLLASGVMGPKEIRGLIKLLQAQIDVLSDEG